MFEKAIKKIIPGGKINDVDLIYPFVQICEFLKANPDSLSWRSKKKPSLDDPQEIELLAKKFVASFLKSDFPATPGTVPDEMVSIVLKVAYDYDSQETERIKIEHQHSMCAENCVGALLERYLDSVLRKYKWVWCCGDFVKAVDFILPKKSGWLALQIKNRDNSENSSSSAIRANTEIQKWFRTFSRTGKTNWDDLPEPMQGKGLCEKSFIQFVKVYLTKEKDRLAKE